MIRQQKKFVFVAKQEQFGLLIPPSISLLSIGEGGMSTDAPVILAELPLHDHFKRNRWYACCYNTPKVCRLFLFDTRSSKKYYPNKWVGRKGIKKVFKYFLDRIDCLGNATLISAASGHGDVWVYLYRRRNTRIEFEGRFKVGKIYEKKSPPAGKFVFLYRVRSALEATDDDAYLAHLHRELDVAKTRFRSGSEGKHFQMLQQLGCPNLEYESWTRNNIVYTWEGTQKLADYTPDFVYYEAGRTFLVESKCSVEAISTEENIQKMAAMSTQLGPNFCCLLLCDHEECLQIFYYNNGLRVAVPKQFLRAGPVEKKS